MGKDVPQPTPNQKPLSTHFRGRKGVFEAAFAGNAIPRSAVLSDSFTTNPVRFPSPAHSERLANRAVHG
jgi:hypothetical protein